MAGVFGKASGPFGSSSVFGNTTNSSNSFAPNAFRNTTFPSLPTQGSVFGASSTGAFGAPSSSTLVSTPTSDIGQASGSFGSFSGFGSTSNASPNPFSPSASWNATLPTQGSVFGGSSSGVFGAPSSSTLASGFGSSSSSSSAYTPTFMSGQASGSFGSSSMIGSNSNSSYNLFSSNIFGKPAFPSSPTQGSIFGGNSTGLFGAPSSSSTTFSPNLMFGQTSGSFGSSSMFGNTGKSSNSLFASDTRENSASSGLTTHTSTFGGTSTVAFGRTLGFGFGVSTAASGSSEKPIFGRTSNGLLGTTSPVNPFTTSSSGVSPPFFPGTVGPPFCPNTGTKINSYTHTNVNEGSKNVKIISISAMPNYASKSHEELRWEDYELKKSGGLHDSRSNQARGIGSNVDKQHSNISLPSFTSPWGSTSAPIATTLGSNPIMFSPQLPVFNTPAPSTNMNTLTFQNPPISNPAPSPNLSWLSTNAPASSASEKAPSIFKQGPLNQPLKNSKPPTQSVGIWSAQPSPMTPNAPLSQSPSTTLDFNQFNKNNSFVQPIIAPTPSPRTDLNQTTPAQSPSTAFTFSIGNNGVVSLEPGQPSLSQQFVSTSKVTDNIVAVRNPFGSQSGTSQPSIGHLDGFSLIQHGISSMPVTDKPATARVPSLLTSRHLSHRPLKVHVRKYHPKSDGPKVPFFYHTEEAQNKHLVYNFVTARENPREVFDASTVLTHLTTTKDEASSLNNASAVLYEDDNPDGNNAVKDQIRPSRTTSSNNNLGESSGAPKEIEERITKNCNDIKPLMPKLQRLDYYTEPNIEELASTRVQDFVVGRHGYGWIKFSGETDVSGLDLDALVHFGNREVVVYMDDNKKPPVGQGLNKAAEVTLLNIKCTGEQYRSKKMIDKYIEKLKKAAETQGAEFVSYDPVHGEWKFLVKHFSWYGIQS